MYRDFWLIYEENFDYDKESRQLIIW